MREKGATPFDRMCHKVFASVGDEDGTVYRPIETGIKCGKCGCELETYYCEERLYVVECPRCKTKALVMAHTPAEACYKTFAWPVQNVDDSQMGEVPAVFFDHVPIDEYPMEIADEANLPVKNPYTGEEMKYFIEIPCPGTDGSEWMKEEK